MQKESIKRFLMMAAAGGIGSVVTLLAVPAVDGFDEGASKTALQEEAAPAASPASQVQAQPVSTSAPSSADVVEQASEAIVGIMNMTEQRQPFSQSMEGTEAKQQNGTGSGVIYKVTEEEAYIVTNHHVIEGASDIQVSLHDGETIQAEVVGTDSLTDIAVLKINGSYDVTPLAFGDSDSLRAGDPVIAIGNPLGLDLSRTVTQGIISAVDRTLPVTTSAGEWELEVIQTDAAINPGNSGGALINSAGQLIGINSLKITENGVEGLGFAIPSNDVQAIIEELTKNGQVVRPYLGVSVMGLNEVPPYYIRNLPEDVTKGAIVVSIDQNSAAAKAGMEAGDIIVSINEQAVEDDGDLRQHLYKKQEIGDSVTIEFYHDGRLKAAEVTLTSSEE
ncbi:S1C family serine protease [Bacillus thermotolerans]|uniref:Serine protease, DegP/HtrA, do-like family n=1 Tax=Bacillus thermotolerans TaxID=1221996 RepID=A0A0F5I649_BACTR|nr:trypsin-like peptidase domain-containing protein [Bacillus thermotolerans]KKB40943.1 Serine protease, DegP/HtrA, do-like family [Bacillus thermotolerans]